MPFGMVKRACRKDPVIVYEWLMGSNKRDTALSSIRAVEPPEQLPTSAVPPFCPQGTAVAQHGGMHCGVSEVNL